jgi:biopolymer transport protein ExbB
MFDFIDIIVKGGPVMVPLLLCSIISLTVTIERFLFWRRIASRAPVEELLRLVERQEIGKASKLGADSDLPVARVLVAGLFHRNSSPAKALEVAAQAEIPLLKERLVILDTIVTLAPLLGLLGTITGMISSFGIMSEAGLGQPHAVTGGVAEALIATATGLLIAILTLIPYNYFSNRAERELEQIEYYGSRLELLLAEPEEKSDAYLAQTL